MAPAPTASQTFYPINELSTYQNRWTIKAKVTTKSPFRTFAQKGRAGGEGKVFHVELLDKDGGEIRASFFNDAAAKFGDMLEVGKVYTLSRGTIKIANRQYNACNHRYEITFESSAQIVETIDEIASSAVVFNFTDLRTVQSKPLPYRADLCGIITGFSPLTTISAKDGRELLKRDITIADDTGTSMDVTLWGEKGKLPDSDLEGQLVVGLKGVLVKEWNGGRSGSMSESGTIVFRPDAAEAQRIEQWWKGGGSTSSLVSLGGAGGQGGAAARNAPYCSLLDMRRKMVESLTDQAEHFSIIARLAVVQTRKQGEKTPLHHISCVEPKEGKGLPCNRRVDSSGFCAACNRAGKTAPKVNARCRYSDFGDSAWLQTFHEASEQVLNLSAEKLAETDVGADGREKLEGSFNRSYFLEPFKLTVRAKLEEYNGEIRTNVTCIGAAPVNRRDHGRRLLSEIKDMLVAVP